MITARLALVSAVTVVAGLVTMPAAHANSGGIPILDEAWKVVHQIVEETKPSDTCLWLDHTKTNPEDAFVCAPTGPLVEGLLFDTLPTDQQVPELP